MTNIAPDLFADKSTENYSKGILIPFDIGSSNVDFYFGGDRTIVHMQDLCAEEAAQTPKQLQACLHQHSNMLFLPLK